MRRRTLILALIAGLMLGFGQYSAPALADEPLELVPKDSRQRHSNESEPRVSLDQAASMVRARYGGKVIRAETRGSDHYVKILTENGRVRTVRVDSRTGQIH